MFTPLSTGSERAQDRIWGEYTVSLTWRVWFICVCRAGWIVASLCPAVSTKCLKGLRSWPLAHVLDCPWTMGVVYALCSCMHYCTFALVPSSPRITSLVTIAAALRLEPRSQSRPTTIVRVALLRVASLRAPLTNKQNNAPPRSHQDVGAPTPPRAAAYPGVGRAQPRKPKNRPIGHRTSSVPHTQP